jgi:hypothetical protein
MIHWKPKHRHPTNFFNGFPTMYRGSVTVLKALGTLRARTVVHVSS